MISSVFNPEAVAWEFGMVFLVIGTLGAFALVVIRRTLREEREEEEPSKAEAKARTLLLESLSPNERSQLEALGFIEIPSFLHKRRFYRVYGCIASGIEVVDEKLPHQLCIIADDHTLPDSDQVLARILSVKANEATFLEVARKFDQ